MELCHGSGADRFVVYVLTSAGSAEQQFSSIKQSRQEVTHRNNITPSNFS